MSKKYDPKRGRHKKNASRETRDWNSQHLVPKQPPWMGKEAYHKLIALRSEIERPVNENKKGESQTALP